MSPASRHLLATFLILLLGKAMAEEPAGPQGPQIERLIKQLGDDSFEQREAASRRLEEIGEAALPALKRAADSQDPEVRRRASELAKVLQERSGAREARRIIERGVKALGGEAKLSRYKALRYKYRERVRIGPFTGGQTGDCLIRYPCHFRKTSGGLLEVFDGKRHWFRRGYFWDDAGEYLTTETREALHGMTVATLLPLLRGEGYALSLVEGKDASGAVGVRVSHRGHRDVELFFDPGSGFLVRYETLVMSHDEEVRAESLLEDYGDFGGSDDPGRSPGGCRATQPSLSRRCPTTRPSKTWTTASSRGPEGPRPRISWHASALELLACEVGAGKRPVYCSFADEKWGSP
jgi:hypothetical protein